MTLVGTGVKFWAVCFGSGGLVFGSYFFPKRLVKKFLILSKIEGEVVAAKTAVSFEGGGR